MTIDGATVLGQQDGAACFIYEFQNYAKELLGSTLSRLYDFSVVFRKLLYFITDLFIIMRNFSL